MSTYKSQVSIEPTQVSNAKPVVNAKLTRKLWIHAVRLAEQITEIPASVLDFPVFIGEGKTDLRVKLETNGTSESFWLRIQGQSWQSESGNYTATRKANVSSILTDMIVSCVALASVEELTVSNFRKATRVKRDSATRKIKENGSAFNAVSNHFGFIKYNDRDMIVFSAKKGHKESPIHQESKWFESTYGQIFVFKGTQERKIESRPQRFAVSSNLKLEKEVQQIAFALKVRKTLEEMDGSTLSVFDAILRSELNRLLVSKEEQTETTQTETAEPQETGEVTDQTELVEKQVETA